jgi:hypothetical protein
MERFGQFARNAFREVAQLKEGPRRYNPGEIGRQPTHGRRNRHVIVIEDDDQTVPRIHRIVHRLIGHPRRHGAITNDRDAASRRVRKLIGNRKAESRTNRRRRMGRAERIIFTLGALGKT